MSNKITKVDEIDDFSSLFDIPSEFNKETLDNVFGDFSLDDELSIKLDEISADLTVMMLEAKKNRTELAESLGWKKSRITKILSGQENLTIKTIFLIARKLGWDYDITYRHPHHERTIQPWHALNETLPSLEVVLEKPPAFVIQNYCDVAADFTNGKQKNFYISIEDDYVSHEENIISFESTFIELDYSYNPFFKIESNQGKRSKLPIEEELIYEEI